MNQQVPERWEWKIDGAVGTDSRGREMEAAWYNLTTPDGTVVLTVDDDDLSPQVRAVIEAAPQAINLLARLVATTLSPDETRLALVVVGGTEVQRWSPELRARIEQFAVAYKEARTLLTQVQEK